jgi:hypothetical protein
MSDLQAKSLKDMQVDPRAPTDTSLINQQSLDVQTLKERINQKIDVRTAVTYTFKGTGEETFDHKLGRVPQGHVIAIQSQNGVVYGDSAKWTDRKVTLKSSAAGNKVTFLFY